MRQTAPLRRAHDPLDTTPPQMIVERSAAGDTDAVGHALTLLVDFAALFVRIAIILLRSKEKREKRDNRNRG